jgi:hypothetical protein
MPATLEKKQMAKYVKQIEQLTSTAIVEVPFAPALSTTEYAARNVELTLSPDEAQALKRIWKALDERGAQLADGRFVTRPGHAVQWLLSQIVVSAG